VEQALADLAYFIEYGLPHKAVSKVFTFGGSYSGALSAWFRVAYPNHTVGSLSSSGVVDPIRNFWQFDEQVSIAAGKECAAALRETTALFEAAEDQGQGRQARKLLGAREGMIPADFFYLLADSAAMAVQYGHKESICKAMVPATATEKMAVFANFTASMWGADFGANCFYDTECLVQDQKRWQPTSRSWRWQKCTELAYLQAAPTHMQSQYPSLRSSRYVTMPALIDQCRAVFGNAFANPNTRDISDRYGSKKPRGSKIYFSNGSDDPWQRAAVEKTVNALLPELTIECSGCGHCVDLATPSPSDPPELKEGRAAFGKVISTWLS